MHASDGHGVASKVEYELTVTVYADDVAFASGEDAGEDSELYVVFGEFLEWVSQERHSFWIVLQNCHERLHYLVFDGCWLALASVVHQMVLRITILQKFLKDFCFALQEYESTDGWL